MTTQDVDVRDLSLSAIKLAKSTPELVPAFVWLIAAAFTSNLVRRFRVAQPSPEELAAVVNLVGKQGREILSHRKRAMKQVQAVQDLDLMSARRAAMSRLGISLEAFVFAVQHGGAKR